MEEIKTIRLDLWNIHYVLAGTGPHVVLCMPGTLGSIWSNFKPQIEGFNREQFTVVVWDPPGYGRSCPPTKIFNPDFYEEYADHAHQFMELLGYSQYSVLGWCGGGRAGIIMAAKYPKAVRTLVIWSTNSFVEPIEVEKFEKYKDITLWKAEMREPLVKIYGLELLQTYWASWVDGLTVIAKERNGNICSDFLERVECPTLIIYGDRDVLIETSHGPWLHERIKNSTLHRVPNGKHDLHITKSEEFNKLVQEYLLQH